MVPPQLFGRLIWVSLSHTYTCHIKPPKIFNSNPDISVMAAIPVVMLSLAMIRHWFTHSNAFFLQQHHKTSDLGGVFRGVNCTGNISYYWKCNEEVWQECTLSSEATTGSLTVKNNLAFHDVLKLLHLIFSRNMVMEIVRYFCQAVHWTLPADCCFPSLSRKPFTPLLHFWWVVFMENLCLQHSVSLANAFLHFPLMLFVLSNETVIKAIQFERNTPLRILLFYFYIAL